MIVFSVTAAAAAALLSYIHPIFIFTEHLMSIYARVASADILFVQHSRVCGSIEKLYIIENHIKISFRIRNKFPTCAITLQNNEFLFKNLITFSTTIF